jgi:predicted metal-dependent phosphoesterase TrpH
MEQAASIHFAWREQSWLRARTGVSLHSHTSHSRETLDFLPRLTERVPVVRELVRAQESRYRAANGRELNYLDAWWTPPLGPRESLALERGQIEGLGLGALVSLTDHDNIEAPLLLRVLSEGRRTPVSVEWTVPYRGVIFHIGVHNLPPRRATQCMEALAAYTRDPRESELEALLEWLNEEPDTLVVMNHPYWDEKQARQALQDSMADEFLRRYRPFINALELNGLRPWSENRRAAALAARFERPVVSGGDRHCCEPNALLNLTNADTFSEFVEEVREYGRSHVLVMPQYREPVVTRILRMIADVMRDNAGHTHGWVRWSDRVFVRDAESGAVEALSQIWSEYSQPLLVRGVVRACRLLDSRGLHAALRQLSAPSQELA